MENKIKIRSLLWFKSVGDLMKYLETLPPSTEICGVGGGDIVITRYADDPDTLWFE